MNGDAPHRASPIVLPSFDEQPASPPIDTPGVAIRLGADTFRAEEPAVLHGSYWLDAPLIERVGDEPLRWIQIVVTARDRPGLASRPAREPKQLVPATPRQPVAATVETGGWFNVDLREHLGLAPGRYFVVAILSEHRSAWLPVELLPGVEVEDPPLPEPPPEGEEPAPPEDAPPEDSTG